MCAINLEDSFAFRPVRKWTNVRLIGIQIEMLDTLLMRTLLQPGDHLITTTSTENNSWCDGLSVLVCDKQVRWIWPDWGWCVYIYISFSTSQVNHEMFPKAPPCGICLFVHTESSALLDNKTKSLNRRRTWRPDHSSFLKSTQARILNAEVPERHESLTQTSGLGSRSQFYTTVLRDEAQSGAWPSTGVSGPTRSVLLSMESSLSWGGGADSDRGQEVEISACKSSPFIWFGAKEMLLCPEEERWQL